MRLAKCIHFSHTSINFVTSSPRLPITTERIGFYVSVRLRDSEINMGIASRECQDRMFQVIVGIFCAIRPEKKHLIRLSSASAANVK
jgi:hypothetical protein